MSRARLCLAILAMLAMSPLQGYGAGFCPELSDWLAIHATPPAQTISGRSLQAQEEYKARSESALKVFASYMSGGLNGDALDSCLTGVADSANYLYTLQDVFFQKSIEKIAQAQSPSLRRLSAVLSTRLSNHQLPLFRITGHFKVASPTSLPGGYHRETESIFVDFAKVPSNEWMIIFIHELLHGLDDEIFTASDDYAKGHNIPLLTQYSEQTSDPSGLPADVRSDLEQWLRAGLGRGLWAEFRAWVPTLVIYEEGKKEGLWTSIDWLEKVLSERHPGEDLAHLVYRYLDQRSVDPTEGIFAKALIRNALGQLRKGILESGEIPSRGRVLSSVVEG